MAETIDTNIDTTYIEYELLDGCQLRYYERFLPKDIADTYMKVFQNLSFAQGHVRSGKENRLSCFYSTLMNPDGSLRTYSYAGKRNISLPFTDDMTDLMETVAIVTGQQYNSCLANLYPDGKSAVGYHSDDERSLYPGSTIASISFGAERWFDVSIKDIRGITDTPSGLPIPAYAQYIRMKHGSMITMAGLMQQCYKHQVRRETAVKEPRINLTFRRAL